MRKIIHYILIAAPLFALGQTKQKLYYSVTAGMGVTNSLLTSTSTQKMFSNSPVTYNQYVDSTKADLAVRHNFSFNVWLNYSLGNKWDFQGGVGYIDMGYRRKQKNIQFGDATYPGLGDGMMAEFSNSEKHVYYDYRFYYVQVPLWFNYNFYKSKGFKTNCKLTMGITPQFLVAHKLTARLKGFKIDEKDVVTLDSTGFDGRTINMQLNLGCKIEHKISKQNTIIIQPVLGYHPLSVTNEPISTNPFMFMLHVGLIVDLNTFKSTKE